MGLAWRAVGLQERHCRRGRAVVLSTSITCAYLPMEGTLQSDLRVSFPSHEPQISLSFVSLLVEKKKRKGAGCAAALYKRLGLSQ